jgi:hypothetical protein
MRPACTEPQTPPAWRTPGRHGWLAAVAWLVAAVGSAQAAGPAGPTGGPGDAPGDCGLLWRVTALLDTLPRQLQVDMVFDAGGRSSTHLRLPGGWAGVTEAAIGSVGALVAEVAEVAGRATATATAIAEPRLLPVPGAPTLRRVQHGPAERVRLQWRLLPTTDGTPTSGVRLAARWLAFSGQGVLPMPLEADERAPPTACIALAGLAPGGRWVSSHGAVDLPEARWRVAAGAAPLAVRVQQALFAGGALLTHATLADGLPLTVALPQDGPWRFNAEALHQAAARAITAQRRYWGDSGGDSGSGGGGSAPPWLLLLMPADADQAGGTAWHQALALQATADLELPGSSFDLLLAPALTRAWVAERFGPLAHAGRGDEGLRAWFSEGVADFLAHRSLLRQGLWTTADYAASLNRRIDAYLQASGPGVAPSADLLALPALQGEWLALRWHAALLAAGRPGLETQLQRLLVPAAQARREGPISAPLATHRLLASLRPVLGDTALADLKRHVELGARVEFGPALLGPCFLGQRQAVGRWQLGFDPASLKAGVLLGVEPGSAAEAAGLRNGLRLRGHTLAPGDASQAVWLQLQDGSGPVVDVRYLPAAPPMRDLPRYESVPQALQRPDCQAWLGPVAQAAQGAGGSAPHGTGGAAAAAGKRTAEAPASVAARSGAKSKPAAKAQAGKPKLASQSKAATPATAKPKPAARPQPQPKAASKSVPPRR